jgi:hypothetical protein
MKRSAHVRHTPPQRPENPVLNAFRKIQCAHVVEVVRSLMVLTPQLFRRASLNTLASTPTRQKATPLVGCSFHLQRRLPLLRDCSHVRIATMSLRMSRDQQRARAGMRRRSGRPPESNVQTLRASQIVNVRGGSLDNWQRDHVCAALPENPAQPFPASRRPNLAEG